MFITEMQGPLGINLTLHRVKSCINRRQWWRENDFTESHLPFLPILSSIFLSDVDLKVEAQKSSH
jgi:hypothetical protein